MDEALLSTIGRFLCALQSMRHNTRVDPFRMYRLRGVHTMALDIPWQAAYRISSYAPLITITCRLRNQIGGDIEGQIDMSNVVTYFLYPEDAWICGIPVDRIPFTQEWVTKLLSWIAHRVERGMVFRGEGDDA